MVEPDYCLQLFLAAIEGRPGRAFRAQRIPSARLYRLAAWPNPAMKRLRRIPRHRPPHL
jgi:hypothetical protein